MNIPEAHKNLIFQTLEEVRYTLRMNEALGILDRDAPVSAEKLSGFINQCRFAIADSAYERFLESKKEES